MEKGVKCVAVKLCLDEIENQCFLEKLSLDEIEERIIRLNGDGLCTVWGQDNHSGRGRYRVELSGIRCFCEEASFCGLTHLQAVQNMWQAVSDPKKRPLLVCNLFPPNGPMSGEGVLLCVRWNAEKDDWEDAYPHLTPYQAIKKNKNGQILKPQRFAVS